MKFFDDMITNGFLTRQAKSKWDVLLLIAIFLIHCPWTVSLIDTYKNCVYFKRKAGIQSRLLCFGGSHMRYEGTWGSKS